MPRSEYYDPALLPGEKEQPQIIIDAVELYDLLVRAEMMMTKADRIRYGNRAVAQIQDVIKEFMLAYDFEEDRRIHLKRLCANMAVFMWTVIACLMQLKILQHHFDLRVRPLVEEGLTGSTFNNRVGYGCDRAIRNCKMAIRKWNRLVYPSMLGHFLDSINSYLGNFKHKNAYGIIRDLVDEVSPKWEKYCHYNDDRRCFEANEGYKHNDILKRKYHFKLSEDKRKKNDKTGNRGQKECPALPRQGQGGEAEGDGLRGGQDRRGGGHEGGVRRRPLAEEGVARRD